MSGAEIALINPRRKHHKKHRRVKSRRRRHTARRRSTVIVARRINPRRRHHRIRHRRYRHRARNPRFSVGGITRALVPAAIGGAGAVALDIALGYATFLPPSLTTGYGKVAAQVAGAFGLGMVAGKVLGPEKGRLVTMGALTVAAYSLIKNVVKNAAPTLPGLAGDYESMRMGAYMDRLGSYTGVAPSMGAMSAYMPDGAMSMSGVDGFGGDGM
jgi:hypothetical protein